MGLDLGLYLRKEEGSFFVGSTNLSSGGKTPMREFTNLEEALAFVQLERIRLPYEDFDVAGFATYKKVLHARINSEVSEELAEELSAALENE
ncbi:MAG: hypothetical protein Greene071421_139 [Parcubacteria group bacterium Greene0714_21]|nr:MAG: hypothetical protein Greene041639_213 [Parcubacteria group bacterium Greene0416_39]TSC98542.1 MAG: hypothetical protein Greene101447_44 [Parcubacteria group bacterium Greene1014_47]TSD04303.1 MAG: hypothetical protein Greene071421_139 [Parcubacteria group bacterium Greene0714_21]